MAIAKHTEDMASHGPALYLLCQLKYKNAGYEYLTPSETVELRGANLSRCVLEPVLKKWLLENNRIQGKSETHTFSENNIRYAVDAMTKISGDHLLGNNEKVYDFLTLGKSFDQSIDGVSKSRQLQYINWKEPEKNVYHVTDEFEVERTNSHKTRRPDIVVFVNGIPLVIIECKRPGLHKDAVKEGISQHLRNQKSDEIPELFNFSQLLLSLAQNSGKYATTGTPQEFWSTWKEREVANQKEELKKLINNPLPESVKKKIFSEKKPYQRKEMEKIRSLGIRLPSDQDRLIHSLLRPERLMKLIYQFIVFDNKEKKICRHQQYFAVQATLERVTRMDDGKHQGGVIWHTTGSSKSLTMVMMAKALALNESIKNPRIILVTDRVNLDDQIYKTFLACGKGDVLEKAKTGKHLISLLEEGKKSIITTIIDKFESASQRKNLKIESPDIFVLVDESHRSQYGVSHAKMFNILPNACYIGFTGTPLLKKDKSTSKKFGGFIHKYTMNQAVQDGAVVPLLYEGRMSEIHGDKDKLDKWFDRITEDLTEKQKSDLKNKFKKENIVLGVEQRLGEIAFDIQTHFIKNFKGTGAKGQLVCSSKREAIQFKKLFDDFGKIKTEVIISPPDTRENHESIDESKTPEIQTFWKSMMKLYGTESKYNDAIIRSFKYSEHPEIIIVVDKLLTGFDAPVNSVLYIDKRLKDHNILQAIARVNRVFEHKTHGLIIDYRGVFGHLNDAIDTYAALENEGFDKEDIEGTLYHIDEEIRELAQRHSNLWEIFKEVGNKGDTESLQRALEPLDIREDFYKKLNLFSKTWQWAKSNAKFQDETPEETKKRYDGDLKMFVGLRAAVKQRYGETVDYSQYEKQLEKMVSQSVSADPVEVIIEQADIFNHKTFEKEVSSVKGDVAKADVISNRMKRSLSEKMEENPAFYKELSKLIEETITAHREKRISDAQYLEQVRDHLRRSQGKSKEDYPEKIRNNENAKAYFGTLKEKISLKPDILSDISLEIDKSIKKHVIRDWVYNQDVQNKMMTDIEGILFASKEKHGLDLSYEIIEELMEAFITVAKNRESC